MKKKVVKKEQENNNKKTIKTIALSIITIIFLGGLLFLTFKELLTEKDITINTENIVSDADRFEKEYEDINNTVIDDRTYLSVNIPNPNPIKYINTKGIIEKLENKETFILYFGYAKCPWCRVMLENMINQSKEYNVENIYYMNIEDIRGSYKLNDSHELVVEKENTDDYKVLLSLFDNVLDVYESLKYTDEKGKEMIVPVNEKRIYAPTVILVKEGVPFTKVTGIPKNMTDPYLAMSDDMIAESKDIFNKLYEEYNSSGSDSCLKEKC